jgi:hypothetical protein
VRDRQAQTIVRASVATDGTETGFELGSLNAALRADGQAVAFESRGLVPQDSGFPVDVHAHDDSPSAHATRAAAPTVTGRNAGGLRHVSHDRTLATATCS